MAAPSLPDPSSCTCDGNQSGDRVVTADEIRAHCTADSCWVLLNGAVWDLTPFLKDHPGGPGAILEYAGRDATALWESIHPKEVLGQLAASLRVGEADHALVAASQAPETLSEKLLHACKMGGSTEVDELLAARADPNFQGGPGQEAPLHWAARKGLPPMVSALLAASADVEARDAESQTPLLIAVRNSQTKVIDDLLAAKAEINTSDKRGETPLHAAASLGSVRLIRALLSAGADAAATDNEGNTPAETAAEMGHMAAEQLIAEHSA